MVHVTRKEIFSAAHKLSRPDWSQEKNLEIFGKCANPNWHGHNYELFVTVKGEPDPVTGFVINLSDLSEVIKKYVLDKVDHKNINLDTGFMKGRMASTEILAMAIWEQLEAPVRATGCYLHCVKIRETAKNYVEYFGPQS